MNRRISRSISHPTVYQSSIFNGPSLPAELLSSLQCQSSDCFLLSAARSRPELGAGAIVNCSTPYWYRQPLPFPQYPPVAYQPHKSSCGRPCANPGGEFLSPNPTKMICVDQLCSRATPLALARESSRLRSSLKTRQLFPVQVLVTITMSGQISLGKSTICQ